MKKDGGIIGRIACLFTLIVFVSGCEKPLPEENKEKLPGESTNELPKLSAGVFGGSISSYPGSELGREVWQNELGITVESNGIGGAGFSTVTGENNICNQLSNAQKYDVYILWASTNDVAYTELAGIKSEDAATQAGGIKQAVRIIKSKNKNALILFFTSLPRFDLYYDKTNLFVKEQIALCESLGIPYWEQNKYANFTKDNYTTYYVSDNVHLNRTGYSYIAKMQVDFMRELINSYYQIWLKNCFGK